MSASNIVVASLWISQLFSLVGSDITKFALRVWVFRESESLTQFTLLAFCTEAPGILLSPFLGLAIDKLPRRAVIIGADVLGALITLALYAAGPSTKLVVLCNVLGSLVGAVHWAAFTASATLLVPPAALVRFGGMVQFAPALSMLVSKHVLCAD